MPLYGAAVALLGLAVAVEAAPSPPPPPGAIERATVLVAGPGPADMTSYLERFSPSVTVFRNTERVADGREQWRAFLEKQRGIHVFGLKISYGNPIISVESVNTYPSEAVPGVVVDCCSWARVMSYHLASDGRVDRVEIVESDSRSMWGPPDHPE